MSMRTLGCLSVSICLCRFDGCHFLLVLVDVFIYNLFFFRLLSKNGPWWFLHRDFQRTEVSVYSWLWLWFSVLIFWYVLTSCISGNFWLFSCLHLMKSSCLCTYKFMHDSGWVFLILLVRFHMNVSSFAVQFTFKFMHDIWWMSPKGGFLLNVTQTQLLHPIKLWLKSYL